MMYKGKYLGVVSHCFPAQLWICALEAPLGISGMISTDAASKFTWTMLIGLRALACLENNLSVRVATGIKLLVALQVIGI